MSNSTRRAPRPAPCCGTHGGRHARNTWRGPPHRFAHSGRNVVCHAPHHTFSRMAATTRTATWRATWRTAWWPTMHVCVAWWGAWCHRHGDRHANDATRPTTQRMRVWRAAMPPSYLPRVGPRLGGLCMALAATTVSSKPRFSLLTIFSLSLSLFLSLSPLFVHV